MPRGGARGQNLGHFFFVCVESFVFEQQVLFEVEYLYLSMISDLRVLLAKGGARGKKSRTSYFLAHLTLQAHRVSL